MTTLVELREKLKILYGEYGVYVQMAAKFLVALGIFLFISSSMDYGSKLSNIFVQLILALVCSILPLQAISLVGCVLLMGQCFALSLEMGALSAILLLAILLLYLRMAARDSLALVLTPLAFWVGIPAAVPMGFGLVGGASACLSGGFGVVFYTFLNAVKNHAEELASGDLELLKGTNLVLNAMIKEENLVILVITFVVVTVAVNAIRRLSVDYSWQIAIGTGAMAYLAISIAGSFVDGGLNKLVPLVVGVAGAMVVTLILQFFVFHVDYTRSEYLEYEDEEYHYYVKAIPKVIAANVAENQELRREKRERRAQERAEREAAREAQKEEERKRQEAEQAAAAGAGGAGLEKAQEPEFAGEQPELEEELDEILAETAQAEGFESEDGQLEGFEPEDGRGSLEGEDGQSEEPELESGQSFDADGGEEAGRENFNDTIAYDFGDLRREEKQEEPELDLSAVEEAFRTAGEKAEEQTEAWSGGASAEEVSGAELEEDAGKEAHERELTSVAPVLAPEELDDIDFESKLEESLKEL